MRLSTRRNIHVALPRAQHRDRQMRGRAEAKQSHALALLHSSHTQAAKSDDASTKQRRGVQIVKSLMQRKNKIGASECVFRVATCDGVAGERRRVAEILHAA